MELDIKNIQDEIKSEQITTEKAIGGAKNMSSWRDLDEEGKAYITTFSEEYEKWRDVWERLNTAILDLIALGYPTRPTVVMPPSILAIIDRELGEEAFTRTLFIAQSTATKASVTFSKPEDK